MTRFLVERKDPFRFVERSMKTEICNVLNIPGITGIRLFNGYDVEGITDFSKAKSLVFSEAGKDIVYESDQFADIKSLIQGLDEAADVFALAAAADQYDQKEDYAIQLLKIMEPKSDPSVKSFCVIALFGDLSGNDLKKIKTYYINPNEKAEIFLTEARKKKYSEPYDVEIIHGFTSAAGTGLNDLAKKYGINMSADNLSLCKKHFSDEGRDPTVTEMKVLDTYWSDHCRHSTFMTMIKSVSIEKNKYTSGLERAIKSYEHAKTFVYGDVERPLCLMDIATIEMKKMKKSGELDDLEKSDEVNACSIEVSVPVNDEPVDMIVMFKNETHNHPTEIEPFGGASTCLGGAIRDPLSGRAHVFGAVRITGSSDPREPVESAIPGKLPQRQITQVAADGYSSYGNGIGTPLGYLNEYYDPGFKAKRMECGAIVAAAKKADILREEPQPGDVVVLVGGNTGRDGCGGATGSSKEHDNESLEKGGAEVQKGNPITERNIVRLFRKPHVSRMIKRCNDFGAGGVCVAVGELADGLLIDLDKVPVKYPGLDGTELAISESQERMAVVIDANDLEKFLTEAGCENLGAVKIADITDNGNVVMKWRGNEILNISSDFLNSGGVRQSTNVVVSPPDLDKKTGIDSLSKEAWLKNLADLNVCSKKGIAERFDSTAGGVTVFMPYGGKYQKTPEHGLAMRLPLIEGQTDYGTLMTVGYDPALGYLSPFHAAMFAVIESVMKIVVMGGDPSKVRLSFQEYFEKSSTDESWGKPYAALMGAFLAQDELGIPAIGGKDSMSGSFNDINVPPSLISFAVAVADTTKLVSRAFKSAGNKVYQIKVPCDESGVPNFDILKQNMRQMYNLNKIGCINAASVVGAGGIAAAVSEMAFGNGIGFSFDPNIPEDLFSPEYTSVILELQTHCTGEKCKSLSVIKEDGTVVPYCQELCNNRTLLGVTQENKSIDINAITIPLIEAQNAWEGTLNDIFPIGEPERVFSKQYEKNEAGYEKMPEIKRTEVLIPIFPGTTGEYELEKCFKNAGAEVSTVLFRNMTGKCVEESFTLLTDAINKADVLVIPSGMSAGAEPDGAGKMISLILRHNPVKDAVNRLLNERKGLVLGIGEGFKVLLKTGLIQTGTIQDDECGDIIMIANQENRHHCTLKTIKYETVDSQWLKDMNEELETVPVSGKETTVHMSDELYKEYSEAGQIASHYIGEQSPGAIEAMVSKNGRVLGRTGLVENLGKGLYVNVFDAKECKIFFNGVNNV